MEFTTPFPTIAIYVFDNANGPKFWLSGFEAWWKLVLVFPFLKYNCVLLTSLKQVVKTR